MPRQRFFNLDPKARSRLLGIATKQFAKRGFEGASLNEILAKAGISKGAYYYYFDDKEDLFATALENAIDTMLARLTLPNFDTLSREQFWPRVEQFMGKWAAEFDASSDLIQVAVQLTDAQRASPHFAPLFAKAQTLYRTLIEPGQRLGCIRRDLPLNVLGRLLEANDAVLDSIFLSLHEKVTQTNLQQHVNLVFDTFKRLLIASETPKKRLSARPSRRRRA